MSELYLLFFQIKSVSTTTTRWVSLITYHLKLGDAVIGRWLSPFSRWSNPLRSAGAERRAKSRAGRVTLNIPCMVELGVSANTRAIIVERQRLLESQTADVRASKRNAALLKDLESLLQTLQRKQHARLAQEARAASAELGGRQRRMREAQAREAQGLREALAEVHCRREQAAEEFKEELQLREAAARSKQQLRVELELERFDNATRSALRLGASAEISAAEDKVQVHTAPPS